MNNYLIKKIIKKLDIGLLDRVPVVHQTESSECGLACLSMICGYYGKNIDLIYLRQQFNISSRGSTLAGVSMISEQLGMKTRALSLDLSEISELKMPCILHWDFNHFVVVVGVRRNSIIIHDPARGRRALGLAEVSKHFTGVALEVWPNSQFTTKTIRNRVNLKTLIQNIHGIKGALTKIFCLSVVVETINLVIPIGTQLVMDHVIPAGDYGLLTLICSGIFFFILLRTLTGIIRSWSSLVMESLIDVQWKFSLFSHLMRLPLYYFERRKLGDIQSRFESLDTLRTTFTTSVIGAIMDSIMSIGVLIMMVLYGGHLTWVVIGFTSLYVIIRLLTYSYYRQLSEEVLVKDARANSYFMETLYGISTVKIQGMIERRSAHWLNLMIDKINSGIKVTKMDLFFGGVNSFISACDQVVILWLGASLVLNNQMTIGMFVAFGLFRGQFSDHIASLTDFLLKFRMMSLHNERISDIALNDIENNKPDILYSYDIKPVSLSTIDLSYRYDSQSQYIFRNLNITILPGESVAIVGPSGAGKTTLLKVLCGLFTPESGRVMVDGKDIKNLGTTNYYKIISCVMQEDKLFSGSIRENICGFTDNVDEEWMLECAKASYIHDIIIKMPMGYETLIGELGEGLSGGQKQRIFIARAIYRKPRIIFMDEATSHLDSEGEQFVNQAIKKMEITRVIIAHRKSTIESADRVIHI
ncbi:peptidase domain-containing ABC transporter [Xenorhabdus sp. TH1]|uniref:peptidase domain-containing ABC transporter n=1 Tax=Xenorhabdus sp. TH1 TaxID=3130166 RepID=UPI0030D3F346